MRKIAKQKYKLENSELKSIVVNGGMTGMTIMMTILIIIIVTTMMKNTPI
jgi:uncharacterized membrane protein